MNTDLEPPRLANFLGEGARLKSLAILVYQCESVV